MKAAVMLLTALPGGLLASAPAAAAPEILPGPVPARVTRVIDGDTLEVMARIWLGLQLSVQVRVAGIDTPELRGQCTRERAMAAAAREAAQALVSAGEVMLRDIQQDKWGGRVVASVATADGFDLGDTLVETGLAERYDGKGPRPAWCSIAELPGR